MPGLPVTAQEFKSISGSSGRNLSLGQSVRASYVPSAAPAKPAGPVVTAPAVQSVETRVSAVQTQVYVKPEAKIPEKQGFLWF